MRNSQNYGVGGNISLRRIKRRMREERKSGLESKREKRKVRQINMKTRFSTGYDNSRVIKGHHSSHLSCDSCFL